jgi:hypothetical protein
VIGDWNGIIKIPELYQLIIQVSIEHDLPFVDDPYGGETLENYHNSQVTRMKAKTKTGNDQPIVVLPYSFNHLTI